MSIRKKKEREEEYSKQDVNRKRNRFTKTQSVAKSAEIYLSSWFIGTLGSEADTKQSQAGEAITPSLSKAFLPHTHTHTTRTNAIQEYSRL